jgi:hypothetical protein
MLRWYNAKERDYTSEKVNGSNETLLLSQTKADLRIPGLYHFSWRYIKSASLAKLKMHRVDLIALLRFKDRHYINEY